MSRLVQSRVSRGFGPAAAATLAALVLFACANNGSASDSGSASVIGGEQESPVGCWTVHVGDWADAPEEVGDGGVEAQRLAETSPTWTVRLDSAQAPRLFQGAESARAVETYLEEAWRDHPFQRWRVVNDSIVVDHPAALSGTTLRVAVTADGLQGLAVAHSDVPPEGELPGAGPFRRYAAVRMVRAECPE